MQEWVLGKVLVRLISVIRDNSRRSMYQIRNIRLIIEQHVAILDHLFHYQSSDLGARGLMLSRRR